MVVNLNKADLQARKFIDKRLANIPSNGLSYNTLIRETLINHAVSLTMIKAFVKLYLDEGIIKLIDGVLYAK